MTSARWSRSHQAFSWLEDGLMMLPFGILMAIVSPSRGSRRRVVAKKISLPSREPRASLPVAP
ncbi:hypothetical protein D9M72_562290 [compost metagenome]